MMQSQCAWGVACLPLSVWESASFWRDDVYCETGDLCKAKTWKGRLGEGQTPTQSLAWFWSAWRCLCKPKPPEGLARNICQQTLGVGDMSRCLPKCLVRHSAERSMNIFERHHAGIPKNIYIASSVVEYVNSRIYAPSFYLTMMEPPEVPTETDFTAVFQAFHQSNSTVADVKIILLRIKRR